MLRGAEVVVGSGRSVVLDATFRTAALRDGPVTLGQRLGTRVEFVEAFAPEPVLRRRLREREGTQTVSDAREGLLDTFLRSWEPPTEVPVRRIVTGS